MALILGQNLNDLKKDEFFGYGVDSGTGSFMDVKAMEKLQSNMDKNESYFDVLFDEMKKTYKHTREWANIDYGDSNLFLFSSGYGDGLYASYWGYDENNELVSLTTDFGIVYIDYETTN
jgi:hypothetical protein